MAEEKLFAQVILKSDQLAAIGCLAIHSSSLEERIAKAIWATCKLDEKIGRIFTDNTQLAGKIETLQNLMKYRLNSDAAKFAFKDLYERIKGAIPDRNTVIHGSWSLLVEMSEVTGEEFRMTPQATRTRHGQQDRILDAAHIMEIARLFSALEHHLDEFLTQYKSELSP